jgi:hypothetical protein
VVRRLQQRIWSLADGVQADKRAPARAPATNPLVAAAARRQVLGHQAQVLARALVEAPGLARDHRRRRPALDLQVRVQARAGHRLQRDPQAAVTQAEIVREPRQPGQVARRPRPVEAEHPVQATFRTTVAAVVALAVAQDAPARLVAAAVVATQPVSVAQPVVAGAVEVVAAAVGEDDDDEIY